MVSGLSLHRFHALVNVNKRIMKLNTYLLIACIALSAGCYFFYGFVNLSMMETEFIRFMVNFRVYNVFQSLIFIVFITMIYRQETTRYVGKIACIILFLMAFSSLWNNLFSLTQNGIFSFLLPVVLCLICFVLVVYERK